MKLQYGHTKLDLRFLKRKKVFLKKDNPGCVLRLLMFKNILLDVPQILT